MNLSEPFIRRPVMTVVLTVSAIMFGILAYTQLPVNDLPAVDYPVIQVNCAYPGANPETVAANIATPLERQFMQIPGLELVTSNSAQGFCKLTLQFALSKNIDGAATDVQAALSRATGNLPADLPSPPTFLKSNPNDQPILYIAVSSDTMTVGQLYDLANTQIGQRISIINGVSQVGVYGSKSAVRVKADPSALATRGLTMDDLATAIQQGTTYQGAGQFDGPYRTFLLQPRGQLASAKDYDNLIIAYKDGSPVYLHDVAESRDTLEDERVNMHFWIRDRHVPKATVVMAVYRQAGSNAVQVASAVRALIPEVLPTLPGSITVIPIYDRSLSIVHSVQDVRETLIIAFILVVLVIFMFLGRATDTLIPVVALPLSLLLTFIVMNMLGYSLDNLSLMALTLAIGFLVDDAIVFLENTVRRMEKLNESPLTASINSAKEISFTILSMTLSLAAVFLPLVFMGGLVGRIFREFAITIVVSIIASGVVSLTLTPLMCARMLGQRGHGTKKTWIERVIGGIEHRVLDVYSKTLWFFLRLKFISLVVWLICLAGTIYLAYIIPKGFLPIGDTSFVRGVFIAQEGASPELMHRHQEVAEKAMQTNDSVDMTFSAAGISQFLPSNQGFLIAFLKEPSKRPPLETLGPNGKPTTIKHPNIQDETAALMGVVGQSLKGAFPGLGPQPALEISTGASATQAGKYSYSISGVNTKEVNEAAQKLIGMMRGQTGKLFASVISDLYLDTPNLRIDILRDRASALNVSATRIEDLLRNAYSENYVYLIKKTDDQYKVILEVNDKLREHPEDLGKLYVRSDDGKNLVPLDAVAKWEPTLGPQGVNHINQFPSVTIYFNLAPNVRMDDGIRFVEDSAKQILPSTLRGEFQGEALTFRDAVKTLSILMIIAVFVMYVILAILYESYIHPITVLSTLPTAMVGGLLTLYFFNEEASLYAFVGLFMLMGIVKKNGIMIVDFASQRVNQGETALQAIHDASIDRFRPILMTTLAAIMGAVPIALGWGADGASRRPLGLVIVGGLVVSQFITLYVTPVIYLYLEDFQEKVLDKTSFFRSHHAQTVHEDRIKEVQLAQGGNGNGDNGH